MSHDSTSTAHADGRGIHGGDIWGAARALGLPVQDVLDLSASINPLGPPPGLKERLCATLDLLGHYPDRRDTDLREALAKHHGLPADHFLPGNGSTALINLLARALDLKSIILFSPAFGEFSRALAAAGRHFQHHRLPESRNFALSMEDLEALREQPASVVIVTNPATPSGSLVDIEVLDRLLDIQDRHRGILVVDEAFLDFCPEEARTWAIKRLPDHPRLLVLRSLTKFYCLAGLRLGVAMGHPNLLAQLAPLGEPWSVNTLAQVAGVHCLDQPEFDRKSREAMDGWRLRLAGELAKLGVKVYPSDANYILCQIGPQGPTAAALADHCAAQGVLIRDASSFTGLGERHFRVAVRTPHEQDRLLALLASGLAV